MSCSTREITVPKSVSIVVCDACQATADEQNFDCPANWAELIIRRVGPSETMHWCPDCTRRALALEGR